MNTNKIISAVIVIVAVAGGGSFYAGMRYDQSKNPAPTGNANQAGFQRPGGGARLRQGFGGQGGFTAGEVISKDDKSVTVKLQDGGSKIIFFSDSTNVMKSAEGLPKDIAIGAQITAMGSPNSDGSISAQSIQIRPVGSAPGRIN